MAVYLTNACKGSLPLKPQELIRCLHDLDAHGTHFRCFARKHTTKEDAVKQLTSDIELLTAQKICDGNPLQLHKLSEDVQKQLHRVLEVIKELTDDSEKPAGQRQAASEDKTDVLEQFIAADIPVQLLSQLTYLEFEARKDVMNVCCAMLWPGMPQQVDTQVIEYLRCHPLFFPLLVEGYRSEEASLHCGVVLRSCFRHVELVEAFLQSRLIFDLIRFSQHPSIDIAYDAFFSLREALMEHKEVAANWLDANFEEFFALYHTLLESQDYVVERQALTLLGSILLDKRFQKVMLSYVNDERHLQIHMNLLRDTAKTIQVEAFNVFKIFVANPQKPVRVQQILFKNKDKLVALLESMETLRPDDPKFREDRNTVIARLRPMTAPPRSPSLKRVATSGNSLAEQANGANRVTSL